MSAPKFPNVEVELVGQDGNAFSMIGRTMAALRRGGATPEQLTEFQNEVTSGDYNNVIQTISRWAEVN